MRRAPRIFLFSALFLVACGVETVSIDSDGTYPSDPSGQGTGTAPSKPGASDSTDQDDGVDEDEEPGGIIADIRADTNRDGVVSFDGKSDDDGEDVWDAKHGAVFLANIDDDEVACNPNLDDTQVAKCNDAADEEVNGADDALDLARIKTKPWSDAPSGASATITWSAEDHVRLFKVKGSSFTVVESGTKLSASEIKSGIELGIEAQGHRPRRGVVGRLRRRPAHGQLAGEGASFTDTVRMRVAPVLTYHHLLPPSGLGPRHEQRGDRTRCARTSPPRPRQRGSARRNRSTSTRLSGRRTSSSPRSCRCPARTARST